MLIERLTRGAVIRAERTWTEPAGKGVNISRALVGAGLESTAVIPVGGANGRELGRLLAVGGVDFLAVEITGEVRSNVSVVEPDGTVTKLNEAGPELSESEVDGLIEATLTTARPGGWVAASGSLSPGMPIDFYPRLAHRLHSIGVHLAVDTSGPPLRASVQGAPGFLKPNRHELAELVGRPLETLGDVVTAAQGVVALGVGQLLVSLGPDGAVLVDADGALHGEVMVDQVRNTVGAGDALLAGFLAAGAQGKAALEGALAWARAAVQSPQTLMTPPEAADREAVHVRTSVDLERVLEDDEASTVTAEKSNP